MKKIFILISDQLFDSHITELVLQLPFKKKGIETKILTYNNPENSIDEIDTTDGIIIQFGYSEVSDQGKMSAEFKAALEKAKTKTNAVAGYSSVFIAGGEHYTSSTNNEEVLSNITGIKCFGIMDTQVQDYLINLFNS